MAKNYYAILGLGCDATPEEIKAAYRRKAHELHPDHGESDCRPFQDIQEAYEALSDPDRRRAYDDHQAAAQPLRSAQPQRSGFGPPRPEPLRPRRSARPLRAAQPSRAPAYPRAPVEPLIPDAGEWVSSWQSAPPLYGPPQPSMGGILDALFGDWDLPIRPMAVHRQEAHLDVRLTMEQAALGCHLRVWIPVQAQCPVCWGQGSVGWDECWECSGAGVVTQEQPVSISLPAGQMEDYAARIAGEQVGMRGVDLVLHVRVR
jgi:molecular chaperone DnaJ